MGRLLQTTAAVAVMKSLLMLFNLIIWVVGIILLGIGIWMKVDLYKYMELSDEFSSNVPWVFMITGGIIIVVCFFACFCFLTGNQWFMYFYAMFLVLCFLVLIVGGIFCYIYRDRLINGSKSGLEKAIGNYGKNKEQTKLIDLIQENLKCCGLNGTDSWICADGTLQLPSSCCNSSVNCTLDSVDLHEKGCYDLVIGEIRGNLGIIGGTAAGISLFVILAVGLSICLGKSLSGSQYESV